MLAVFSPIFVADTKSISRYDFVASLTKLYVVICTFLVEALIQFEKE